MRKVLLLVILLHCLLMICCKQNNHAAKKGVYINCNSELIYYNFPDLWLFSPVPSKISLRSMNDIIIDDTRSICTNEIMEFKLKYADNIIHFQYLSLCYNLCSNHGDLSIFEYFDVSKTMDYDSIKIYPLKDSMSLFKVYSKKDFSQLQYKNEYSLLPEQELTILFSGKVDKKSMRKTSNPQSQFILYLKDGTQISKDIKQLPILFNNLISIRYKQLKFAIE